MSRYLLNSIDGSVTTVLADDDARFLALESELDGDAGYRVYTELRPDDPRVTPTTIATQGIAFPSFMYGDGSDGAHVCTDGEVVEAGMFTDFTIPDGVTVTMGASAPGGVAIQCTGTFTIAGTIDLSGQDATGFNPGGSDASVGGYGDPNSGTGVEQSTGGPGGGDGGAGSAGAGGAYTPQSAGWSQQWRTVFNVLLKNVGYGAASGGSGGTGDTTYYGGGGGGGGNSFTVAAKSLVHADTNSYILTGGRGGDGGDDGNGDLGNGDCGSGGGGGDGWWMTISDTITGTANIVGGGGQPGTPCGTGESGTPGGAGFAIHYTPSGVVITNG